MLERLIETTSLSTYDISFNGASWSAAFRLGLGAGRGVVSCSSFFYIVRLVFVSGFESCYWCCSICLDFSSARAWRKFDLRVMVFLVI